MWQSVTMGGGGVKLLFFCVTYFLNDPNSVAGRNFICERLLLIVSPQDTITNSSGEFGLDEETWPRQGAKYFFKRTEAAARRCSIKKVFLKISQNSQENTCAGASFFHKVAVEHLWWLLLNATILFNQMQPKIKHFFNISIKGTLMQIRKSANILLPSLENNMLQISHENTFYFLRFVHVKYGKSLFTNIQNNRIY